MSNTQKRGFTLVELMVAMSIIAILIGLSVFGISIAQRNARDEERRAKVRDIATALANYYTINSAYPTATTFTALNAILQVPVRGVSTAMAGNESTTNGTVYCYAIATDGYILGAELEIGTNTWFSLSSSATQCSLTYRLNP